MAVINNKQTDNNSNKANKTKEMMNEKNIYIRKERTSIVLCMIINSQNLYAGKEIRTVCLQGGGGPQVDEVTGAYKGVISCNVSSNLF